MNKRVNNKSWRRYLSEDCSPRERYELALAGEPVVCRCVMCNRKNYYENMGADGTIYLEPGVGHYLRYIYDEEDKDYCCNECYDLIRRVVHNQGYYDDMVMPKGDDWVKETEKFEATLDKEWTEKDIMKIVDEEIS